MGGHCTLSPAAVNRVATAAPHSELHGVTGWVMPGPLTELSTTISVLNLIHSAPLAGTQAPRALALEANRLLRLVTVALISKVVGPCMEGGWKVDGRCGWFLHGSAR